jgi:aryl-alcohol dehydrogenase-like predicted oxidoreductase
MPDGLASLEQRHVEVRDEHVAKLAPDDWRAATLLEPRLSSDLALRDALRPIAQRHSTTVSAVAVAWTIAWPGVAAPSEKIKTADPLPRALEGLTHKAKVLYPDSGITRLDLARYYGSSSTC